MGLTPFSASLPTFSPITPYSRPMDKSVPVKEATTPVPRSSSSKLSSSTSCTPSESVSYSCSLRLHSSWPTVRGGSATRLDRQKRLRGSFRHKNECLVHH